MFAKVFATQYTAFILLLVTFVLGAYVRPDRKFQAKAPQQELPVVIEDPTEVVPEPVVPELPIGKLSFDQLFFENSSELTPEKLEALITVLKNHDVELLADVNLKDTANTTTPPEIALTRSVALFRYLLAQGLPAEALEVRAKEVKEGAQVEVILTRKELDDDR